MAGEGDMKQIRFGLMSKIPGGTAASPENEPVAEFEDLALPHLSFAYNLARWLVRNHHDAEDLVQETYLKAYRNFHSFQAGTNFRAWMYRILHNTFLSSRTGSKCRSSISLDSEEYGPELAIESKTPETILVMDLDSRLLQRAIEELPVHYREALLLCDLEEMSYRQIAEILSIPIGTVMSRLARARKLLRESLRRTPESGPPENLSHLTKTQDPGSQSCLWKRQGSVNQSNSCCTRN
jgi:RNA polymerase sigma-70 factor (ECF subfamily)